MSSSLVCYFATFVVILTYKRVFPVKGQCTVQGCGNGDSSISFVSEIQQLFAEAIRQQQNEQVQYIHELLNASFQQMKNQQDTITTSLQALDRRSHEQDIYNKQIQSIHELLNASFYQMKNQQDNVITSLQAVEQRSQEQDIYIKQVQSIPELLNASFQQMMTQHEIVLGRVGLHTFDRRLQELEISIKNQTQNSWKLVIAVGIDLEEGPVLPPIVNNWIVLMYRFDGSLNFSRNWIEYKNGFGDIRRGEFWLGNEKIHRLTNRFFYTLRIEVYINRTWYYADYATFSLDSESSKYAIRVSGFSGNAGDSLTNNAMPTSVYLGGMSFTTWDADNDRNHGGNCANYHLGGWWFNHCDYACLTCPNNTHFKWYSLSHLNTDGRLQAARMMIKSII